MLVVKDEGSAYWMLIATVHGYFPSTIYDVTMGGAHIDQVVLMMMVYEGLIYWLSPIDEHRYWMEL